MDIGEEYLEKNIDEILAVIMYLKKQEENIKYMAFLPPIKASIFLMLYNCIEGVVYQLYEKLFDCIAIKPIEKGNLIKPIYDCYDKYQKTTNCSEKELMNLTLDQYVSQCGLFSGNLDSRKIRELMRMWGIHDDFHVIDEEYLLTIKTQRNILAHGNRSFADVGRGYLVKDIEKYNKATLFYLKELRKLFYDFISADKYITQTSQTNNVL